MVDTRSPEEEAALRFSHTLLDDVVALSEKRLGSVIPPPTVYHYTTSAGVLGIVKNRSLFLSDARFLNDASELTYGRELAREALAASAARTDPPIAQALSALADNFDPLADNFRFVTRCYVACFCEDGNLLSQWRGYSHPGDGVALGFLSKELMTDDAVNLRRVTYDPAEQRDVLEAIVDLAIRRLSAELPAVGPANLKHALIASSLGAVAAALALLLPQLKNPRFSEEREWRLVRIELGQMRMRPLFRHNGHLIQPYIELTLRPTKTGPIPIVDLVHGPSWQAELRHTMLCEFMLASGFSSSLTIRASDTPLRTHSNP